MKLNYLLALLLLLLPACIDSSTANTMTLGGSAPPSVVEPAPDYTFHIEFDSDTDWESDDYTIGGEDYSAGDQLGVVTNLTQNITHFISGAYACRISGATNYMYFDVSAGDLVTSHEGFIELYLWPPDVPTGTNYLFELVDDSSNVMKAYLDSSNNLNISWRHQGSSTNLTDVVAVATGAWRHIEIRWDVDTNALNWQYEDGGWSGAHGSTALADFTVEPMEGFLYIGELNGTTTDTYYIEDLTIWDTYDKS